MKKIKMIYDRQDNIVLDSYIKEFAEYDRSKLELSFKVDGTACMIKNGKFYKRYDNKNKPITKELFENGYKCYENSKHQIWWVPVGEHDYFHWLAWKNLADKKDGTYELLGPKVNNNRHNLKTWMLIPHKSLKFDLDDLNKLDETKFIDTKSYWIMVISTSDSLFREWWNMDGIEGLVLWDKEKDEPMFKIRKDDLPTGMWKDKKYEIDVPKEKYEEAKEIYRNYKECI